MATERHDDDPGSIFQGAWAKGGANSGLSMYLSICLTGVSFSFSFSFLFVFYMARLACGWVRGDVIHTLLAMLYHSEMI